MITPEMEKRERWILDQLGGRPDHGSQRTRWKRIRIVAMYADRKISEIRRLVGVTERTIQGYCDQYRIELADYTPKEAA